MITTRPLPTVFDGDPLLGFYHEQLIRHWTPRHRALAAGLGKLAVRGTRDARCRALGIPEDEARLLVGIVDPAHYLSQLYRRGIHRLLNPAAIPLASSLLKDKRSFAAAVANAGLPAPETFSGPSSPAAVAAWFERHGEIVAKPNYSSRGRGVARYRRIAQGWADSNGTRFEAGTLAAHLTRVVSRGGLLQQAMRTAPRLSDISPGALPTLRVHTFRLGGTLAAHGLVLRIGGGSGPVDNFSRGGLAAAVVDGAAGDVIGKAGGRILCVGRHPATGVSLEHIALGDLADTAVRLGIAAHAAIGAGYGLIGWDIGLADCGPVLIEGNWNPGHQLTQFTNACGLSALAVGRAYLQALEALPASAWADAAPLQWDGQYLLAPKLAPLSSQSISTAGLQID